MCEWVSDALRAHIAKNYKMAPAKLDAALAHAETVVKSEPQQPTMTPAESTNKLIDKLYLAGQLKAGFLLRVLHQGQIDLFDLGFARLLDIPLPKLRQSLYELGPRPVALACRAVGIDRCVFSTVYNLSRQAKMLKPVVSTDELAEVEAVFRNFTKADALAEIQAISH